jgi:hypothetical protein
MDESGGIIKSGFALYRQGHGKTATMEFFKILIRVEKTGRLCSFSCLH